MPDTKHKYVDLEQVYVNKGYCVHFFHIPTARIVWFKGLITKFDDKYDCQWSSEDVYGRSDPIENFKNTKRVISISWDVVASYVEEAKENMEKASLLLAMLYPVYGASNSSNASHIVAPPLFKLSFANLIHNPKLGMPGANSGLVGRMGGLSFSPKIDEGFFDQSMSILYPKSFSFSCDYTIYHTHPLGWNTDKNPRNDFSKFPYGETIVSKVITKQVKETSKPGANLIEQQKAKQEKILKGK